MFILFLLKTVVKILGNNCFNADAILSVYWVIFAVSVLIHIMSPHITADSGVLIHPFQFFTFGITVILKSNRVVGQAE